MQGQAHKRLQSLNIKLSIEHWSLSIEHQASHPKGHKIKENIKGKRKLLAKKRYNQGKIEDNKRRRIEALNKSISLSLSLYIYIYIYIYMSLFISTQPQLSPIMLNIGWWCFIHREEAKVALGYVTNFLIVATVLLSSSALPPVYPTSSSPPLPSRVLSPLPVLSCPVPILVPVPVVPRRPPYTCEVHPRLFPPPYGYLQAWPLLRLQTQIKNRSRYNVLCGHFMASKYVHIHCFQTHLLQSTFQRGVLPAHIHPSLQFHPRHYYCHPIVENPQDASHLWGHCPLL